MNKEDITSWLNKYKITNYTIHDNLVVDVHEKVSIYRNNLISLPFKFGIIQGDFYCFSNQLTSLEHCPKIVQGNFSCSGNNLTSLEYCPKEVHRDFYCHNNQLTSLEHCPKVIQGSFYCDEYLKKDIRYLRHYLAGRLQAL